MDPAKRVLGAGEDADWLDGYYQYSNRLSHLAFLRERGVDAWMVFLCFVGDAEMHGSCSEAEWLPHIKAAREHLGLSQDVPGCVNLFAAVDDLRRIDMFNSSLREPGSKPPLLNAARRATRP